MVDGLDKGYTLVDIDPDLKPDFVASVLNLPFDEDSYDMVVCFQVLEHIRYKDFGSALIELKRVAQRYVVISLPDARQVWPYQFYVPKLGLLRFFIPRARIRARTHTFDGQHYWEINKKGYPLKQITSDIESAGLAIENTYRVEENPYHRFFVMKIQ